jgi:hypothetical protein
MALAQRPHVPSLLFSITMAENAEGRSDNGRRCENKAGAGTQYIASYFVTTHWPSLDSVVTVNNS